MMPELMHWIVEADSLPSSRNPPCPILSVILSEALFSGVEGPASCDSGERVAKYSAAQNQCAEKQKRAPAEANAVFCKAEKNYFLVGGAL
jgi:hypothetical protein